MRKLLAGGLMALTLGAVACGGSGDSTGPESIAGTYVLQTVNGSPPPFVLIQDVDFKVEVLSGSYTLNADNTFSSVAVIRVTDASTSTESSESITGTYTRSGSTVTFTDTDGFQATATVTSTTLTLSADGIVAVYAK